MTHKLKIHLEYFKAILFHHFEAILFHQNSFTKKNCEIRNNDRGFNAGDRIHLCEWIPETTSFTGHEIHGTIKIVFDSAPGLQFGCGLLVIDYDIHQPNAIEWEL